MDKKKIEHLKEKRELLKDEIRLKEMRKRIAPALNYLEAQNFTFRVFYDFEYVNWINQNVKVRNKDGYRGSHGDFQIDLDDRNDVPTIIAPVDDFLRVQAIVEFFNKMANDTTLIICSLTGQPELEVSKDAFLSKPSIFFSSPETWILSADRKYIIENIRKEGVVKFIDISQAEPILCVKAILKPQA